MARLLAVGTRTKFPSQWRRRLRRPTFGHRLLGVVDNVEDAREEIRRTRPDLVLLDAEWSDGQALVACRMLASYETPVIAIAPRLDDEERAAFLRAGAAGYLLKTIDAVSFGVAVSALADFAADDDDDMPDRLTPPGDEDSLLLASRRDVISWVAAGTAVAAVPVLLGGARVAVAEASADESALTASLPPLPGVAKGETHLLRMQRELRRALSKPLERRRWVMVIDTRKCIGCHACTIACKAENRLPPGVVYRPVLEEETGTYPNVQRKFIPRPCMQCDKPPCVIVCPVGATWKRKDGIVTIDYEKCIGCRYCIAACPYSARTFDFGEHYSDGTPARQPYEEAYSPEYNGRWDRGKGSPEGNARKCHFCLHRLNAGQLPACVTTCIGHATYFGDANDSDSLVSELIRSTNVVRLKEELGTKPKVYYLV